MSMVVTRKKHTLYIVSTSLFTDKMEESGTIPQGVPPTRHITELLSTVRSRAAVLLHRGTFSASPVLPSHQHSRSLVILSPL